ncbi:MAG: hypothetical protein JW753_08610 [Dehalococcoidia bacterium]|nr:hypothetical protein [Dehalococcoidia bacterium]
MADKKNGNRRLGAGVVKRAPSSAGSGGDSGATPVDLVRVIKSTCRGFARAADWRQISHAAPRSGDCGTEGPATGYRLSEDHEGLHSGRYISVTVMRGANSVAIEGGYHDAYRQPRTVRKESVPLEEVTAQALGSLLMEMHDRLCNGDRRQAT